MARPLTAAPGASPDAPARAPRWRPVPGWIPASLAAVPFALLAVRVVGGGNDPLYSGDAGFLALAVRSAAHAGRAVGPYSRFGFFHPGPAMFYLLAPFDLLTGYAPWAIPLGIEVLNGLTVAAIVALVQQWVARRWSPGHGLVGGALCAAAVVAYAALVDVGLLQIFWNPLQVILPTVLLLVAVCCIDGWGWPVAAALAAGTFTAQSDLSTVPLTAAAWILGAAWLGAGVAARRRRPAGPARRRHALGPVVVAVLAAGMWAGPVVEQLTGSPGNVSRMAAFFASTNPSPPGWSAAAADVGRELAVFVARIPWYGSLSPAVAGRRYDLALACFATAAVVLAALGSRLGDRLILRLGLVSLVGAAVALYSVRSIRGPVDWYLTAWMSAIAVPLLLGWVLVAAAAAVRAAGPSRRRTSQGRPPGHRRRAAGAVAPMALGAVAAAAVLVPCGMASAAAATTPIDDNRAFPNEPQYRADTVAAWRVIRPLVTGAGRTTAVISSDPGLTPTLAGVALEMARAGVTARVPGPIAPPFGPEERARAGTAVQVWVTAGAPPAGYRVIGRAPSSLLGTPDITVSVPART